MDDLQAETKELRIGLVCYGGVSLAIYMHGVTKELYKFVRAARAFDEYQKDPDGRSYHSVVTSSAAGSDTEPAYFDALVALHEAGRPVTAVVDVIAGTSAGGINGVCLARGLAHGLSVDDFRSVWIDDGDLGGLLSGHALWPFTGRAGLLAQLGESVARLALPGHHTGAPLDGDRMSRMLFQALRTMKPVGPSLIRSDESLDLFTTTTDVYGYPTAIPTGAGGTAHRDRSYRQVLRFHYDPSGTHGVSSPPGLQVDDFNTDSVPALAFAARATSSFPGGFPPVSLASFKDVLQQAEPSAQIDIASISRRFLYGTGFGAAPERTWFMDGGVLDNGPFDHVVDAIANKRAEGEVARRVVYIEPDPHDLPPEPDTPYPQPTWFTTIWTAHNTIPNHMPLTGTLTQLEAMNDNIAEVGRMVTALMPDVLDLLNEADVSAQATYQDVTDRAGAMRTAAQASINKSFGTYCRLRAETTADAVAEALVRRLPYPQRSNQADFVAAVIRNWLDNRQAWLKSDPAALETALGDVDIPFRIRRAHFVLQGINNLFTAIGTDDRRRQQLAELKTHCWDLLVSLRQRADAAAAGIQEKTLAVLGPDQLTDAIALTDPAVFARGTDAELTLLFEEYRSILTVAGTSEELWEALATGTADWDDAARKPLLARYIGYPIWDALTFPTVALARLPQLSPIEVTRFSPLDAGLLKAKMPDGSGGGPKLRGTVDAHFGGFLNREWRENDYLWGRLDGAELILRLLDEVRPGADLTAFVKQAFTAILDTEAQSLHDVSPMFADLRDQIVHIGANALDEPAGTT